MTVLLVGTPTKDEQCREQDIGGKHAKKKDSEDIVGQCVRRNSAHRRKAWAVAKKGRVCLTGRNGTNV